jgi:hypothetical protein
MDGTINIWSLLTGNILRTITIQTAITTVKLSPMAKFVAYNLQDGR